MNDKLKWLWMCGWRIAVASAVALTGALWILGVIEGQPFEMSIGLIVVSGAAVVLSVGLSEDLVRLAAQRSEDKRKHRRWVRIRGNACTAWLWGVAFSTTHVAHSPTIRLVGELWIALTVPFSGKLRRRIEAGIRRVKAGGEQAQAFFDGHRWLWAFVVPLGTAGLWVEGQLASSTSSGQASQLFDLIDMPLWGALNVICVGMVVVGYVFKKGPYAPQQV